MKTTRLSIKGLSSIEKERLYDLVVTSMELKEPDICPHCGKSIGFCKAGKTRDNGNQLFLCKACRRRFSISTLNAILCSSHTELSVLKQFTKLAINAKTLDEISKSLGIAHSTAHAWRMKLFKTINANKLMEKCAISSNND